MSDLQQFAEKIATETQQLFFQDWFVTKQP
jgi:hypothetical protein